MWKHLECTVQLDRSMRFLCVRLQINLQTTSMLMYWHYARLAQSLCTFTAISLLSLRASLIFFLSLSLFHIVCVCRFFFSRKLYGLRQPISSQPYYLISFYAACCTHCYYYLIIHSICIFSNNFRPKKTKHKNEKSHQ